MESLLSLINHSNQTETQFFLLLLLDEIRVLLHEEERLSDLRVRNSIDRPVGDEGVGGRCN